MSISKPIEIRYRWNRENIEKLFEPSYRYQFTHSAKRYIGWIFIAILQFGVVAALKKGSVALLLFASIMLLYWYYGKKLIAKKRAMRTYENSAFKEQTIRILVDEDGLEIRSSGDGSNEQWSWEEIDEVRALGDAVMLYKSPHFHYIPSNGFASLEEKSRFKAFAKAYSRLRS